MSQYGPPERLKNDAPTYRRIVNVNVAALTLTPDDTGALVMLDKADGLTVTLPKITEDTLGMTFDVRYKTKLTSNTAQIKTAGELLIGRAINFDTDTGNAVTFYAPDGSDDTKFTLNGTTTGGAVLMDKATLTAIKIGTAYKWMIDATVYASGTIATPFS